MRLPASKAHFRLDCKISCEMGWCQTACHKAGRPQEQLPHIDMQVCLISSRQALSSEGSECTALARRAALVLVIGGGGLARDTLLHRHALPCLHRAVSTSAVRPFTVKIPAMFTKSEGSPQEF